MRETHIDGSFREDPFFVGPTAALRRAAAVLPLCRVSSLRLTKSQETRNKLSRQTDAHRFEATRGSLVGSGRRENEDARSRTSFLSSYESVFTRGPSSSRTSLAVRSLRNLIFLFLFVPVPRPR